MVRGRRRLFGVLQNSRGTYKNPALVMSPQTFFSFKLNQVITDFTKRQHQMYEK